MVPGDGRMRYRMPKKVITKSAAKYFMEEDRVVVSIGKRVTLHGSRAESSYFSEFQFTTERLALRDDIDPIAFRKAVLDLYANFPSTR